MEERYTGVIDVAFDVMPANWLPSCKPLQNTRMVERPALATQRRRLSLREGWKFERGDVGYCGRRYGGCAGRLDTDTIDT